mgnify:CR=1 FL=1
MVRQVVPHHLAGAVLVNQAFRTLCSTPSQIYLAYAAPVRMAGDLRGDFSSPLKHPHQVNIICPNFRLSRGALP